MPLHAEQSGRLDGLDHAVVAPRRGPQGLARIGDGLVVDGVHLLHVRQDPRRVGAGLGPDGVHRLVLALLVPMAVDALFGEIVDQRPTAHHRQELRPAAHPEHPLALRPGVLDQRDLGDVTGLVDVHQRSRRTGVRTGIEVGVDVTAAGGDEGGTAVDHCGESNVVGVGSGGQDHRDGSHLRQRRHVAAVGRVALGRRTAAEDPDEWADPHAMTAS